MLAAPQAQQVVVNAGASPVPTVTFPAQVAFAAAPTVQMVYSAAPAASYGQQQVVYAAAAPPQQVLGGGGPGDPVRAACDHGDRPDCVHDAACRHERHGA